jgi:hypothetical protein
MLITPPIKEHPFSSRVQESLIHDKKKAKHQNTTVRRYCETSPVLSKERFCPVNNFISMRQFS